MKIDKPELEQEIKKYIESLEKKYEIMIMEVNVGRLYKTNKTTEPIVEVKVIEKYDHFSTY